MTAVEARPASSGQPKVWPLSVASYPALGGLGLIPEKTELLYGQVYHQVPESAQRSQLLLLLRQLLQQAVPDGLLVRPEQPITGADSEPEPDLSIVRGAIDEFSASHPSTAELVIEICFTSHEYDRSKLHAYAVAGVKECWLVLAPEKRVEIHREPSGGEYRDRLVVEVGQRLTSRAVPTLSVDTTRLFGEDPR